MKSSEARHALDGDLPANRPLLLLSKTTGYQTQAFREAAKKLGVPLLLGTDRCHVLEDPWRDGAIALRFDRPENAAQRIAEAAATTRIAGIIALGDQTVPAAAMAAERLGIPFHRPEGVQASGDKHRTRVCFREAGLPVPRFALLPVETASPRMPGGLEYPCVLKPLSMAASRGVIRADDDHEFRAAFARIRSLLSEPEFQREEGEKTRSILVENFLPGREFALEGVMQSGELQTLALFDKPDPLDGPFFEETIYVTPPRLAGELQARIHSCTEQGARALGLTHGPIHAEMRIHRGRVWMLEIAARPIGGLCARALRFERGLSLEEVLIRHSLRDDMAGVKRERQAAGVMMIPVPGQGIFEEVRGVEEAQRVAYIEEVLITAKPKQKLLPWPEGNSYPGFLFARAPSPELAESALREAHRRLHFVIQPALAVV